LLEGVAPERFQRMWDSVGTDAFRPSTGRLMG